MRSSRSREGKAVGEVATRARSGWLKETGRRRSTRTAPTAASFLLEVSGLEHWERPLAYSETTVAAWSRGKGGCGSCRRRREQETICQTKTDGTGVICQCRCRVGYAVILCRHPHVRWLRLRAHRRPLAVEFALKTLWECPETAGNPSAARRPCGLLKIDCDLECQQ